MKELKFNFSTGVCRVLVGSGILCRIGKIIKNFIGSGYKIVIVTDQNVFELYERAVRSSFLSEGFGVLTFKFRGGERFKNFRTFEFFCNFLARNRIKKTDLIVSLGGGVVGDLAGFASACYLRGLRFVQVPTTLLAMVDSSVGGKSAINLKFGKNLVGCFKQPILVLCDVNLVSTLSQLQISSAMAEVVKCAVLFSEQFFQFLYDCGPKLSPSELEFVVFRCLQLKKTLVEIDEFDLLSERVKLNFGHTLGHALETYFGYGKLTHGQAVAFGMSYFLRQSERLGLTKAGEFERFELVLKKFNLKTHIHIKNLQKIFKICLNDKKSTSEGLDLVLISEIGYCFIKKFSLAEFKKFLTF